VNDRRDLVLARIDYLQAELAALSALLRIDEASPPPPPEPMIVDGDGILERVLDRMAEEDRIAEAEPLPPEPVPKPKSARRKPAAEPVDPSSFTIDPGQAATIVGVTRQTIDRRLHDGVPAQVSGRPHNVGRGGVRARWRWRSADDVRAWWATVR
jgi:hypothetical protein